MLTDSLTLEAVAVDNAIQQARLEAAAVRRLSALGAAAAARLDAGGAISALTGSRAAITEALGDFEPMMAVALLAAHLAGWKTAQEAAAWKESMLLFGTPDMNIAKQALRGKLAPSPQAMRRLRTEYGASAARTLRQLGKTAQQGFGRAVRRAVAAGEPSEQAAQDYAEGLDEAGEAAPHVLETVFRTHMNMAYSAGKWGAAFAPNSGVWGWTYLTMRDDRVRWEHRSLDGVRLTKEDPLWGRIFPPNGWNCRCWVVEVWETGSAKRRRIVRPRHIDVAPEWQFNPGAFFS